MDKVKNIIFKSEDATPKRKRKYDESSNDSNNNKRVLKKARCVKINDDILWFQLNDQS